MSNQDRMRPVDLAVVLALAITRESPPATYSQLGLSLGVSSSTTYEAVKRLQRSGLIRPGTHEPNARELRNFLIHGAKHAFPPAFGREARGVPTAHAGPALREMFDSEKPIVWPDVNGTVRGTGLVPLYPKATELPERNPAMYAALTLVDAMRVGQARERGAAMNALDHLLGMKHESSV